VIPAKILDRVHIREASILRRGGGVGSISVW